MSSRPAWGFALSTVGASGTTLDAWFPSPALGTADPAAQAPAELTAAAGPDPVRGVDVHVVRVEIDLDAAPASTVDAYLRLHLLSHRLVRPREVNLDGVFAVLPNVVWTDAGPCEVEGFE